MDGKSFVKSKTFWAGISGLVAGIGMFVQTGDPTALGTSIMGAITIALRFVTKQPLE